MSTELPISYRSASSGDRGPIRFDLPAIVSAVRQFCSAVRARCPLTGGPYVETGTYTSFDADVTAYGELMCLNEKLIGLLNPDGLDRATVFEAGHIYEYADERHHHALQRIWGPYMEHFHLRFLGLSCTPAHRTWMPGRLPEIDPVNLEQLERAADLLEDLLGEKIQVGSSTPFTGGEMAFYRERVQLCGIDICRGPRSKTKRKALDLLRITGSDGQFMAYSGSQLAKAIGLKGGQNAAGGLVRDLRKHISQALWKHAKIECGLLDVILSKDHGYRLASILSVHDGEPADPTATTGADEGGFVPVDDPARVPVRGTLRSAAARRKWILEQVSAGRKLRAPGFAAELGCSQRSVKRDLDALEDQIEFVGSPNSGHYQLKKWPKPR